MLDLAEKRSVLRKENDLFSGGAALERCEFSLPASYASALLSRMATRASGDPVDSGSLTTALVER